MTEPDLLSLVQAGDVPLRTSTVVDLDVLEARARALQLKVRHGVGFNLAACLVQDVVQATEHGGGPAVVDTSVEARLALKSGYNQDRVVCRNTSSSGAELLALRNAGVFRFVVETPRSVLERVQLWDGTELLLRVGLSSVCSGPEIETVVELARQGRALGAKIAGIELEVPELDASTLPMVLAKAERVLNAIAAEGVPTLGEVMIVGDVLSGDEASVFKILHNARLDVRLVLGSSYVTEAAFAVVEVLDVLPRQVWQVVVALDGAHVRTLGSRASTLVVEENTLADGSGALREMRICDDRAVEVLPFVFMLHETVSMGDTLVLSPCVLDAVSLVRRAGTLSSV